MAELNPQQGKAVRHGKGPLLIVAGAGSGKTRTLTERLVHLLGQGTPAANIIAITFTNKAAEEMRARITNNQQLTTNNVKRVVGGKLSVVSQPFVGTFHSLGAKILREEATHFSRTRYFSIFDNDDSLSLIKSAMADLHISRDRVNPLQVMGRISRVKNELANPDTELKEVERDIFEAYEFALTKSNAFDFDDLIEKPVRLFREHPEVLAQYRDRFRAILVDEYQDVNAAQYAFVRLLAEEHGNLSVVGDDAQAIYRFRGADFRNFLNFEKDWPGATVVKLEQNYRSTKTIITAASHLIRNNTFQKPKELWTENRDGDLITVVKAGDEEEEASWIAEKISNWKLVNSNSKPKGHVTSITNYQLPITVAILYRTNAQSRAIEQALIAAEIPYRIFGGLKFYERKEIKDVVAGLRLAANPRDAVSAERIAKTFTRGIAEGLLQELPEQGSERPPIELIGFFLKRSEYFEYLERKFTNAEERKDNIAELIVYAGTFPNVHEFLERVSLLQSADAPAKQTKSQTLYPKPYTLNPINLMTIHLAKGLEFDRVFITGAAEGLLPHQRSLSSQDELEEERRLMYVAMTRAKDSLTISFANIPSRFLYEIPGDLTLFTDLTGERDALPDEDEIYIE